VIIVSWWAPLALHAETRRGLGTLIYFRIDAPGYSTRQATVEVRVLGEHWILVRLTLFSPPIDVGHLRGS
jgi:hypothetical protein